MKREGERNNKNVRYQTLHWLMNALWMLFSLVTELSQASFQFN